MLTDGSSRSSENGLVKLARDLDLFEEDILRELASPTFLVLAASLALALLVSCCLICLICARLCGGAGGGGGGACCSCCRQREKDGYQVPESQKVVVVHLPDVI